MIANYHTHTPRCNHAVGTETEYVRCAVEAGLQTLGFADHTPYPFPKEHYSHFRMRVEEITEYTNAVRAAQKAYGDQIRIHLGVEAEFYPRYFPEMVKILQDHGIEYMLLGQHFLYNEMEGVGSNGPTADEALLRQYCDQTIEAMHTGLFTYFAHPDLMHFVGEESAYRRQIRRLCQAAKACQMPLEVNLLGIHLQRHYPNQRFWEIAAEEGNVVILGTDAHDPRSFLDPEPERKAREMIARLGLELLEDMPLRRI